MVCKATGELFPCPSLLHFSHTVSQAELSMLRVRAFALAVPSSRNAFPQLSRLTAPARQEEDYLRSLQYQNQGPGKEGEPFLPLTLKAQIFPVISVEGTVKLGAGQLLVDGLEDSAMHWVLVIQATCPKHTHALCWTDRQGRTECFSRQIQAQDTLFSQTSTNPRFLFPTSTWKMQDPWMGLSNRVSKQCSLPDPYAAPALWQHRRTHTEQWSGPSPFLHGGPGGALEARRGSAGGQQAQSFELLAGFFSGEKVAGNG